MTARKAATPEPPPKPAQRVSPDYHDPIYKWLVRIWLGDQAQIYCAVAVDAFCESRAIELARAELMKAYPMLADHVRYSPAMAHNVPMDWRPF